jgi:hypothetical protein
MKKQSKGSMINAIVTGDSKKLDNAIKEKQGKVFVIESFLDALVFTSAIDKHEERKTEVIFKDSPFTRRIAELCEQNEGSSRDYTSHNPAER